MPFRWVHLTIPPRGKDSPWLLWRKVLIEVSLWSAWQQEADGIRKIWALRSDDNCFQLGFIHLSFHVLSASCCTGEAGEEGKAASSSFATAHKGMTLLLLIFRLGGLFQRDLPWVETWWNSQLFVGRLMALQRGWGKCAQADQVCFYDFTPPVHPIQTFPTALCICFICSCLFMVHCLMKSQLSKPWRRISETHTNACASLTACEDVFGERCLFIWTVLSLGDYIAAAVTLRGSLLLSLWAINTRFHILYTHGQSSSPPHIKERTHIAHSPQTFYRPIDIAPLSQRSYCQEGIFNGVYGHVEFYLQRLESQVEMLSGWAMYWLRHPPEWGNSVFLLCARRLWETVSNL